jgi:hypothetical protein
VKISSWNLNWPPRESSWPILESRQHRKWRWRVRRDALPKCGSWYFLVIISSRFKAIFRVHSRQIDVRLTNERVIKDWFFIQGFFHMKLVYKLCCRKMDKIKKIIIYDNIMKEKVFYCFNREHLHIFSDFRRPCLNLFFSL